VLANGYPVTVPDMGKAQGEGEFESWTRDGGTGLKLLIFFLISIYHFFFPIIC
jgi:hypothetical protein